MRDLVNPFFNVYLSGKMTVTELSDTLLDFDIVIDKVYINDAGNLQFDFSDKASTTVYSWEIK